MTARMPEEAYRKGREQPGQAKEDLETAKDRGQQRAERAQTKVEGDGDPRGQAPSGEGAYRPT